MDMKKMMRWLVPQEKGFAEMLAEQSGNALEAANELRKFLEDYSEIERGERKARAYAIKKIENKGDELAKNVFDSINRNSRAFIDKEHIQQIAVILDDVTDLINVVASRLVVLSIERIDDNMIKLADVVITIAAEVNAAVSALKKLKNMELHCSKIRELEKKADNIYQDALSDLFHFYKNSIDIIKNKEIYDFLEQAADKCKDLANLMESIAAKHA